MASVPTRYLLWVLACCASSVVGKDTSTTITTSSTTSSSSTSSTSGEGVTILTGTRTAGDAATQETTPTGLYQTFSSTITLSTTSPDAGLSSIVANGTAVTAASSETVTYLTGSIQSSSTTSGNFSTSTTATAPTSTNTQPCNNYVEFCERSYGNITEVGTHNSPFVRKNSIAANQQYEVEEQLNDGVRFLQAQMQWRTNDTAPHFCHTTCDILDAGPITEWLTKVKTWVDNHPYDVVTILLENGNYSTPDKYVPYIESTGILKYAYTPPLVPMSRSSWPTLSQMILTGKRVVFFLDYMANQTTYPWWMDEFSQMWETPFDPTDTTFPCTVQRPPDLDTNSSKTRMYLMNHNLNVEVSLLGVSFTVPAVSVLNLTNAVSGNGSLGLAANNCLSTWDVPPNVLNVDYYNFGNYNGSVFEVAAMMNNVTFINRTCCGVATSAGDDTRPALRLLSTAVVAWVFIWSLV
jgi:hypothetical protein